MTTTSGANRRTFIQSLAGGTAAGLGTAILPKKVLGANDRIQLGIIGVGGHMTKLLEGTILKLQTGGAVQIVAVCDVYRRRLNEAKTLTGAQFGYEDYRELLARDDIDAIFNATPDHWHAPIAADACRAGKDVYVEKPMTLTFQEAKDLARIVDQTGRVLQVGSELTSAWQWFAANRALKSGVIGQLLVSQCSRDRNSKEGMWQYTIDKTAGPDKSGDDYINWDIWLGSAPKRPFDQEHYFRWRKFWEYSGGTATDLLYHDLCALSMCWGEGQFPWRVSGTGGRFMQFDRDVPNIFMLEADFPKLHHLSMLSSMINEQAIPGYLRGHEGTINVAPDGQFAGGQDEVMVTAEALFAEGFQERCQKAGLEGTWTFEQRRAGGKTIEIPTLHMPREQHQGHIENFLECVKTRKKPVLDVRTGYQVMTTIFMSVESYRRGKTMYFDADREEIVDEPINFENL